MIDDVLATTVVTLGTQCFVMKNRIQFESVMSIRMSVCTESHLTCNCRLQSVWCSFSVSKSLVLRVCMR